jgi:biopolymer transport protein TolR
MAQAGRPAGGLIDGINVTPLVDVILVLLLITMVTAKIIVVPAVPVDLPKAQHTHESQLVFSVVVPVSGPILVNNEPVHSDAEIVAQAKHALAEDAEVRAVIQADGAVPHRRVIRLLGMLKQAGMSHVAFGVQPEGEAK